MFASKEGRVQFSFSDGNKSVTSTEFAKSLLASALERIDPKLADEIAVESNWRKNYQRYFAALAQYEFNSSSDGLEFMQSALNFLGAHIRDETGESLHEKAQRGFSQQQLVQTVVVSGKGGAEAYWPGELSLSTLAKTWVEEDLAEPGVIAAFEFLQQRQNLNIESDLLITLAGNAELSFAKDWLALGGRVAVVARPNQAAWNDLIEHAQRSAGQLLVCVKSGTNPAPELAAVAGLDLVFDIDSICSWIREISRQESRVVLASFAYVGGSKQIVTQAAQDAIIAAASANIAKSRLVLSWLATPLDIVVANPRVTDRQAAKHAARNRVTKARDAFWRLFGQLQPPTHYSLPAGASVFDASSARQGSSYLLAKHSEKWRALVAARQGNLVSYEVAPPAKTRSVLSVKVLNHTYRGLWRFGVKPFTASQTRRAMALLLLRNLHDPATRARAADPVAMVSDSAIHGGTWRLAYQPDSIWVAATILGWLSRKRR